MSQRNINIIRNYKRWKTKNPDTCIEHCANQTSLFKAIMAAALSRDLHGKKHKHQYRLQNQTLSNFGNNLIKHEQKILNAKNFDSLISAIRANIIPGIGELTVYDVAVRLGAYLNIWPDKIYLHAGTRIGAKAILDGHLGVTINQSELPAEFHTPHLNSYEVEDILCIYKNVFIHSKGN